MAGQSFHENLCVICRDELSDSQSEALTCSHVFHTVCLHKYAEVQGCPMHLLACPICKTAAQQPSAEMDSLDLQGANWPPATGLQSSGGAPTIIELSDMEALEDGEPMEAWEVAQAQAEQAVVQPPDAAEQAGGQPSAAAEDAAEQPLAAAGPTPAVQPSADTEHADGQPPAAAGPTPAGQPRAAARWALPTLAGQPPAAAGQPPAAAGPTTALLRSKAAVRDVGLFPDPVLTCSTCGGFATLSKMRLASKGSGTWECRTCMTKTSTLRREFGKWPISQFSYMSTAEKQAFMGDIADKNISQIRAILETKFTKRSQHGTYYDHNGEFLPLSVWEKRGYDPEAIKTLTPNSDKRVHPILGETYRVVLIKTGQSGYEGTENAEEMSKRPKNALKSIGLEAPEATPASSAAASSADGPKLSDDGTTSSNSGSSSSSSEKKKKNKKKDKKSKRSKKQIKKEKKKNEEAKVAAKAAALSSKAAAKNKDKVDKLANSVITKCAPVTVSLQSQLSGASSALLPALIVADAKTKLDALQGLVNRAQLIVNDDPSEPELGIAKIQALLIKRFFCIFSI